MQDKELIYQFEQCTLPKSELNHKGHLRICKYYLSTYHFNLAMQLTCKNILRFATSLNAAHIYHKTLTCTWVKLIHQAMHKRNAILFDEFIEIHPHLLNKQLPWEYYSRSLMESDYARNEWADPDLKSLE